MRADILLYERGLCKSRTEAANLIKEGLVSCGGVKLEKPSQDLSEDAQIEIKQTHGYVSRGGLKLEAALSAFDINVSGFVCADIGASTGGFTDCLLKRGAAKVYAIEGGRDQLDKALRSDKRVVSIEGYNARYLSPSDIGEFCDIAVMDVSFISQTLIHPKIPPILKENGVFVTLIKPQFEAGRAGVGKNGIAKPQFINAARDRVISSAEARGFEFCGSITSPIKGGDGNTEFLAYFKKK